MLLAACPLLDGGDCLASSLSESFDALQSSKSLFCAAFGVEALSIYSILINLSSIINHNNLI